MKVEKHITGGRLMRAAVFAVACGVLLTGCGKDPAGDGDTVPGGGPGTDVGVSQGELQVQTSVPTRSAVEGTVLPQGSAIGAVVVTTDGSGFFTPSAATGGGSADGGYYADGRNVRFANETGENTWTSTTAEGKTKLLLFSGEDKGKVYGYYPWTDDAGLEGEGSAVTVPVAILNEGTVSVDAAGAAADRPAYTAAEEIDYMYSSRSDEVGARTTTTARLEMEHVLARVSFRMYASAAAQTAVEGDADSYYEFTGYTLKNRNGSEELVARFDGKTRMSVAAGAITGALPGGEITRRIEGYRLVRSEGSTPEDDKTAAEGSLRVGNLLFPVAAIGHNAGKSTGIEAVFEVGRRKGDGSAASGSSAYALPLAVVAGESDSWLAGRHYTYTVKFTGSSLSVESVTVTDWNEVAGGDMNIGEDPYVNAAEVAPAGDIPQQGGTYAVTLKGLLSLHGTEVRARVEGGETLAEGRAFESGKSVELAVPANAGYTDRTVVFEYKLNGVWTKIGDDRSQSGYSVSSAATNAPATIPYGGGTYTVTLTGILPPEGCEVRAVSGNTVFGTGRITASGQSVSLAVPSNMTGSSRTVAIEYKWNDKWVNAASKTQAPLAVGDLYGGGVVYWVSGSDFRVVAMDQAPSMLKWTNNRMYVLGPDAQDETARNGADVWKIAKQYSDSKTDGASGVFATDFPAFDYCYNKTDGGVPKGTWYLPSIQELQDLYAAKGSVESVITGNGGTAFSALIYWSATESSDDSNCAWFVGFSLDYPYYNSKTSSYYVRCVRDEW